MMTTATGFDELLSDARLVLGYAVRAGRLPDDTLPNAIAAIEGAAPGEAAAKIPLLSTALNAVTRAIAPVTLVELRAGRSPFDTRHRKVTRRLQMGLSVFTIVVILCVAYFTELLHEEDVALRALQGVQDARPLEKLNTARKMVQKEGVLRKDDSQYDQYQRSVAELRALQDKVAAAYELANAIVLRPTPLTRLVSALPFGGSNMPSPSAAEARTPSDASGDAAFTVTPAKGEPPDPVSVLKEACADFEPPRGGAATTAPGRGPETTVPGIPMWLCGVILDVNDEFRFSTMLGLALHSHSPTTSLTYWIQADMAALNGWILPLFYGLLGATVFLMRNILDTRTPNMDVVPSLLRIALGGVAGIVIGWFWVPAPTKSAELAAIASAPFALAFLAGFSIDMLFSLLDRLNRVVSEGGGAPAAHT